MTITFTVTGRGEFPRDMLRYDQCSFATHADRTIAGTGYVSGPPRSVQIVTDGSRLTRRRWESFGWRVSDGVSATLMGTTSASTESQPEPATLNIGDLEKLIASLPPAEWMLICPDGTVVKTSRPHDIVMHLARACPVDQMLGGN